jgi:hypothetical protein
MTDKEQQLLIVLAEECSEVIKEVSKALRFGIDTTYKGTSPKERLQWELVDLISSIELLQDEEVIDLNNSEFETLSKHKKSKVLSFINERTAKNTI